MPAMFAKGGTKAVFMEATVLGPCVYCGVGAEHHTAPHGFTPSFTRPLGVVARWHRNPAVRLAWAAADTLKRRRR